MTPERLQEIRSRSVTGPFQSQDQMFMTEFLTEIARLTRDIATMQYEKGQAVVRITELEAENARLREALTRIRDYHGIDGRAARMAESALQSAKEKP